MRVEWGTSPPCPESRTNTLKNSNTDLQNQQYSNSGSNNSSDLEATSMTVDGIFAVDEMFAVDELLRLLDDEFGLLWSIIDSETATVPLVRKTNEDVWRKFLVQRRQSISKMALEDLLNTGIVARPRKRKQAYQVELDEDMSVEDFPTIAGLIERKQEERIRAHYKQLYDNAGLGQMETALDVICTIHSIPFAQIWILEPTQSASINALISAGSKSYDSSSTVYDEFADASSFSYIQTGKGVVGRAFASQGSCYCKDVTVLSLREYPLVRTARRARLTQCFAICLKSTRADKLVYVVEYFLPPREMVDRDVEIFLNMILSTMKEQLPGVIVASGKELGQRMLVEVLKVSPCDELDSFEIGQPLPSVQSLQDGGETTEIYFLCQQSNIQDTEDYLSAGLLVPSCSSRRLDSFNDERLVQDDLLLEHPTEVVQVDLLLEHPTEATITNRGRVEVDVAHDIEIEKDTSEIMQLESHFEQENIEPDSTGSARGNDKVEHSDIARCGRQLIEAECINGESNWVSGATTNIQRIDSQKNSTKQRIVNDYGITRKILEEHFGMYRKDAAKSLHVSVPTFKRICREYNISRWPHPKTRKVYPHVSQGVSLHGVKPNVGDQHCPNLSQEKGTDNSAHERSTATEKPCDSVMTVKVTYRDDMIKFKLTPSSTRVELEGILEKKLNISPQKFSIKYQDEDNDWVTITEDADLREGMHELRLLGRTTMKLLLTPKSNT